MFTRIPTYLLDERDLSIVGTSGYLAVVIAGAFLGYVTAGVVHDRLGARRLSGLLLGLRLLPVRALSDAGARTGEGDGAAQPDGPALAFLPETHGKELVPVD